MYRISANLLMHVQHIQAVKHYWRNLGLYSLSGKTSYRQISWILEAANVCGDGGLFCRRDQVPGIKATKFAVPIKM